MSIKLYVSDEDTKRAVSCIKDIIKNMPVDSFTKISTKGSDKEKTKQAEQKEYIEVTLDKKFLLEGKPRSEYDKYCSIFNQFITGLASEGREITELTEKYQKFYEIINKMKLEVQESNKLEYALYDVAIEAEMQGFIYGFKLLDAFVNGQLTIILKGLDCT